MADEIVDVAPAPASTGEGNMQGLISQMNKDFQESKKSGGTIPEPISKPKAATPGQPAVVPAMPVADPNKTFQPKPAESLTKGAKIPPTPSVVEKTEPAQPAGETVVEPPPAGAAPATTPPVDTNPDSVFSERLSSLTDGHLKSVDDFVGLINRLNDLEAQAEEGFKPKFKDERAALVHKILAENPGNETEAAMRTLRALSFKPEGKSPKDVLFQAYLLDPKNSDLSELQAKDFFEAEYSEKYSGLDPDNTNENTKRTAQRAQDLAVKEALANITQIQGDFKTVEEKPAAIAQDVEISIKKAVENFGGIRIAFTDNPQENDYLNVAISDPQELAAIQQMALDPIGEWNQFMEQFSLPNGKFDYPNYVRAHYERTHAVELRQAAYDHGFTAGKLAKVNETRNASDPKQIHQQGAQGGAQRPVSFQDAWLGAANAKR